MQLPVCVSTDLVNHYRSGQKNVLRVELRERLTKYEIISVKGFSFFGRNIKSTEKAISFSGRKIKQNKKTRHFRPKTKNKKIKNCYCPRLWNRPIKRLCSSLSVMLYKFDCDYDYGLQMSVAT